ncbi:MAG TPA: M48 family peptidase [Nitrospiraceae bacterium]|nr:M48 family peptidase [Nitrospiraceae bacterium]
MVLLYSLKLSDRQTIDYQVRISRRARNVRLTISAREGLTIIVPHAFALSRIPSLVEAKKDWIASHLERFIAAARSCEDAPTDALPEVISLPALGETWQVEYRETPARSVAAVSDGTGKIVIRGAVGDERACRAAMKRWLSRRAGDRLVPWLLQISEQHGLPFLRAVIKGQRTRWASCSRSKTINLNYKLLFLPPPIVRYILLHELCHTRQLDHSPKFWALVMSLEPEYRSLVKELRQGQKLVPGWASHAQRR